jgi:putative membrane protein
VVVAATWLLDRSPEASRAGTFLESVRQAALAGTGHEALGDAGDSDRERLRASGDVDEDDSALEAYNALLARLNTPGREGR